MRLFVIAEFIQAWYSFIFELEQFSLKDCLSDAIVGKPDLNSDLEKLFDGNIMWFIVTRKLYFLVRNFSHVMMGFTGMTYQIAYLIFAHKKHTLKFCFSRDTDDSCRYAKLYILNVSVLPKFIPWFIEKSATLSGARLSLKN